jgi:hypothetical protein
LQDRRENFASFEKPSELAAVLLNLSRTAPVTAEEFHRGKVRLWAAENALVEKRKELVRRTWELNYPEAALQQQEIMEQAWAVKGKERLCAISRDFLHMFCVLPQQVGIHFERHDPAAENPDDPVPSADCDWLSGEFLVRDVRNFPTLYARASLWPQQNIVVELKRFYTDNIRCAWKTVVDAEILPQMEKIREERSYTAPWRDLIKEAKALLAPWSIPRPWPAGRMERKNATDAPSARGRRIKTSEVQAVTA